MHEIMKHPELGLDNTRAAVDVAYYYMDRGDYKRAEPYATDAAESGAGWAMLCAADCYEGLKDWETAEQFVRSDTTRYPSDYHIWYLWCQRTGKGDVEAAKKVLLQMSKSPDDSLSDAAFVYYGIAAQGSGETQKAAHYFQKALYRQPNINLGLLTAASWDQIDDFDRRNAALKTVKKNNPYFPVAEFVRKTLEKGEKSEFDVKEADTIIGKLDKDNRLDGYYCLSRFMDKRGQKEAAVQYLQQCVKLGNRFNNNRASLILAHTELRARGITPEEPPRPTEKK
jgi:tetratricopeptide (TPR) repeat protein